MPSYTVSETDRLGLTEAGTVATVLGPVESCTVALSEVSTVTSLALPDIWDERIPVDHGRVQPDPISYRLLPTLTW